MISRRVLMGLLGGIALLPGLAMAQDKPAPFDKPGDVKIALVRNKSSDGPITDALAAQIIAGLDNLSQTRAAAE